jgi:hypothetical protein
MSLEMAHKVILPPKKNYIPQFLKQRDINSYFRWYANCRENLIIRCHSLLVMCLKQAKQLLSLVNYAPLISYGLQK